MAMTKDKIKTIIVYDEPEILERIEKNIKELEEVEIVGKATTGIDAYNKIINLKPEIVFTKYDLEDMNGLELILCSENQLANETPTFKFISNITKNEEYIIKENDFVMIKELSFEEITKYLKTEIENKRNNKKSNKIINLEEIRNIMNKEN